MTAVATGLARLSELGVIAPDAVMPIAPRSREEREQSEAAELARLGAKRCPECGALPPNDLKDCSLAPMPDPDAERCGCGYVKGSLGCRMAHGGGS